MASKNPPEPLVRVLCVGNSLARDDGVGIYVARILEGCPLPSHVVVERAPSLGLDLLDRLTAATERLVIVDAMRTGRPPGRCAALDVDVAASYAGKPYCGHALGLAEVLAIAARIPDVALPGRLTIVGIEAQELEGWGTELSEPVRAGLPDLVALVVDQLGADRALRDKAVELARDIAPEPIAEALGVGAARG